MQNGDYDFIDRTGLQGEELRQSYIKTFGCDTFFTSSNAVTENGELYNVDGNSNRVACIVYGPRQVIMIVGVNKIVKDINEAIYRVSGFCWDKRTTVSTCTVPGNISTQQIRSTTYPCACKTSRSRCRLVGLQEI